MSISANAGVKCFARSTCWMTVSYTHLDVYKRQVELVRESFQNIIVEMLIDFLSWRKNSLWIIVFHIKKTSLHWLHVDPNLMYCFQSWWLSLICAVLFVHINPCFVTSNDLWNEVWVFFVTRLSAPCSHELDVFFCLIVNRWSTDFAQCGAFQVF